ncbi:hypothetical protein GOP47_0013533 [Adiantum capillus-veneris]|uniref:Uncharacterized protein n=1 Tax=Adiantum capillus-veneris TaxID=13818 RepID=A0A9D4UP81_ADICA|nr:hypothetical protein GOP47_0013533 [Adiantum capillus-veneris]
MPSSHDIGGSCQLHRVFSFEYPDNVSMHDFIFLDLPYGGLMSGYGVLPMWDTITEDDVRAGIHLAWNTLSDFGWLLIMASFAVLHHTPYGFMEARGDRVHFDTLMFYLVH